MPASGSHRPFETGLVQELSERNIFFQSKGLRISLEDAAHVVEFLFLCVLWSFFRGFCGAMVENSRSFHAVDRGDDRQQKQKENKGQNFFNLPHLK